MVHLTPLTLMTRGSANSATTKHPFENFSPRPIVCHYLCDPTLSRFHTIPECDRHTDGRTDTRRRHVPHLA